MKAIEIPDNLDIDLDKLKELGILVEKNSSTYDNVLAKLNEEFGRDNMFLINNLETYNGQIADSIIDLVKLINTAKYLNGNWKPNRNNNRDRNEIDDYKFYICISDSTLRIQYSNNPSWSTCQPFFETIKLAQQAIDILGENTIKNALTLNY